MLALEEEALDPLDRISEILGTRAVGRPAVVINDLAVFGQRGIFTCAAARF